MRSGGSMRLDPAEWATVCVGCDDNTAVEACADRQWWPHLLAVAWLLLIALALLAPALVRGPYLGPYQLLLNTGLLHRTGVPATATGNSDLITEMISWSTLTWSQVHQAHLPLWNPSSGFGMPLAFNWQSAPFGLPALVGYLFPMQFAFTVGVIVTLMVAGTGTYVFSRVLGLGVIASVMAGTFFELSGPFLGWLGYPLGAVMSWMGWLLAAGILILRGKRRARNIAFFAVVLAFAVYAGNPESLAVLAFAVALFFALVLALQAWHGGLNTVWRPVGSLMLATIAGVALAAPLALPGYQLGSVTTRVNLGGQSSIPLNSLTEILLPNGFRASANPAALVIGPHIPSTIGFIAIPLALAAVARRWRRPVVLVLAILVVVFVGLLFSGSLESIVDVLPFMSTVIWSRALMPLALALSVLAGIGANILLQGRDSRRALLWMFAGFGGLGLWLLYSWFSGNVNSIPALNAARDRAYLWPAIDVVTGIIVVSALFIVHRLKRLPTSQTHPENEFEPEGRGDAASLRRERGWLVAAAAVLLGVQTVTLAVTGSSLWQSSSTFLPTNQSVVELQKAVGTDLLGFGAGGCSFGAALVALPLETNVAYSLHEVGVYDPIIPPSYFSAWQSATGQSGGVPPLASFCPAVTSAAIARRFGIGYVLVHHGAAGPSGAVLVKALESGASSEDLYKIPRAAAATITPLPRSGTLPAPNAVGTPVKVTNPNPSTWGVTTSASGPLVLRLHLTDVPGWRATIDGRPLQLERFSGVLLQARIPAGRHSIVVTYWPTTFTVGLVLAAVAAFVLTLSLVVGPIKALLSRRVGQSAEMAADNLHAQ